MKLSYKLTGIILFNVLGFMACTVAESLTNRVTIKNIKSNTVQKSYGSITIAGFGTSATRLFFENLYDELKIGFNKKNVITDYKYLGNDSIEINSNLKKLAKSDTHDVLIILSPQSSAYIREKDGEYPGFETRTIKLLQGLNITFFDREDLKNSLCEFNMDVNINLTQKRIYRQIAEKVIENLKFNKLLE